MGAPDLELHATSSPGLAPLGLVQAEARVTMEGPGQHEAKLSEKQGSVEADIIRWATGNATQENSITDSRQNPKSPDVGKRQNLESPDGGESQDLAPPDGGWGWVVVVGATLILVSGRIIAAN